MNPEREPNSPTGSATAAASSKPLVSQSNDLIAVRFITHHTKRHTAGFGDGGPKEPRVSGWVGSVADGSPAGVPTSV